MGAATMARNKRVSEAEGKRTDSDKGRLTGGRQRITLEFSAQAADRLREIKETTDAASNADVIRRSLLLYDWVLSRRRENRRIQLVDDTGKTIEIELLLPGF